jgi:hypothetical protein
MTSSRQLWGGPRSWGRPWAGRAGRPLPPRGSQGRLCISLCIHGVLVGLLALSSGIPLAARRSLYDQEIRLYEHKLIGYNGTT